MNIQVDIKLEQKVLNKLERCSEIIKRHFGVIVDIDELTFNVPKNPRVAGSAQAAKLRINLNPVFLNVYKDEFIQSTVVHEFAHIATRILYPFAKQSHGPEFKKTMRLLGSTPRTYHQYSAEHLENAGIELKVKRRQKRYTYMCRCRTHQISASRHNKMKRGQSYFCATCNDEISLSDIV